MNTYLNFNKETGFTLIELLVVLFIIGVLTALIFPNLMGARQRARDSQRKQDLVQIKNALRLYYNDNQRYPNSISFGSSWSGYMEKIPQDPLGSGHPYRYCVSATKEGFILAASLENAGDADIAGSQSHCPTSICDPGCTTNCFYICTN